MTSPDPEHRSGAKTAPNGAHNSSRGGIRHLVISDLHLGALNSVLTNVTGVDVEPDEPSPVMAAFGSCMRALVAGGEPPSLVVLGDMFELALTPIDDAASTFGHLVRAIGLGDPDGAVGPEVRFVAGNHDHHLWTRARIDEEVAIISATPPDVALPPLAHVTPMVARPGARAVRAKFVEALVQRAKPTAHVSVVHSYPNFALVDPTGTRAVVMHHGHFVEHLYRIVSSLDDLFEAVPPGGRTVADLEGDNGGWIDFFWSSEGDSGDAGIDVRVLYESLVSGRTIDAEIARVGTLVTRSRPGLLRRAEGWVLTRAARRGFRAVADRERHHAGRAMSSDAEAGLAAYLAGPIVHGLRHEVGHVPPETTFVFGHTHKPFVSTRAVTGFDRPVAVVNTGGWVVDHPAPEPLKGATVVLVDEHLATVTLEMYRQRADGTVDPPAVHAVGPDATALAADVRSRIDATRATWVAFAAAVDRAVADRRRQLVAREAATEARLKRASRRR